MLYIAATSYIIQNEARFFYEQEKYDSTYQYNLQMDFQELEIPLNEEIHLHALWLKHKLKRGLVLYFPGDQYLSGQLSEGQKFYYDLGYDIIIPDYRYNGKSTGKYHSEEELYLDADQWVKMAVSLSDSLPLVLVGQDFGCGLAAQVYAHQVADLLILQEPYWAWNEIMLKKYFWWLPHSWFTKYEIPTWKYLRDSTHPVVLIHPSNSKNIGFKNSELLLEYLKPGDRLITIGGEEIDYESKEFLNKFENIKLP